MKRNIILILTLLLAGRAMTVAFIPQAGSAVPGAPPAAWLMPLIGDAIVGITAVFIAFIIWQKKSGLWVWTVVVVWNSLAIWDALSAFLIHTTNPWPEFFMIKLLGSTMFFAAAAMHLLILILVNNRDVKNEILGRGSNSFKMQPR